MPPAVFHPFILSRRIPKSDKTKPKRLALIPGLHEEKKVKITLTLVRLTHANEHLLIHQ